jgi:hypothetical protein
MKRDLPEQTYEWHFLTRFPPNNLDKPLFIEMFRRLIKESADAHTGFETKLRQTALTAIKESDPELIRQALQCLAHVGTAEDIESLTVLENHTDPLIGRDAKTCVFEIRHRANQPG